MLNSVVSFVVIPLQFPVDLRGPTHNTDAQNIAWLLFFVVTPPTNRPHGVQGGRGLSAGRVKSRRPDWLEIKPHIDFGCGLFLRLRPVL